MRACLAYIGTDSARLIEWLRLPGDLAFIIFGAVPLSIGAIKAYIGLHKTQPSSPQIPGSAARDGGSH